MDHTYYFNGNEKTISWVIENNETKIEQTRVHAEHYYDKVSVEQPSTLHYMLAYFGALESSS